MRYRLAVALLAVSLITAMLLPGAAALSKTNLPASTSCADALNSLGLFNGTDSGYELERAPSRIEAVAVLVRLLNKEKTALNGTWNHNFKDVPSWASPYVGYAYNNSIANGISSTSFGAADAMSSQMYLTLVLRALGYSDANGDFTWNDPFQLAKTAGILPGTVDTSSSFMRGDVVLISWAALNANIKGGTTTLASKLISEGAFTQKQFEAATKTAATVSTSSNGSSSGPNGGGSTTTTPPVTNTNSEILSNSEAKIDVTNKTDGYIRVAYTGSSTSRIKVTITGPDSIEYRYDLNNKGNYETFILSAGSGSYKVIVAVNVSGTSYSLAYSQTIDVTLKSEFAPFLAPNQYVNYTSTSEAVKLGGTLTADCKTTIDKVKAIYEYVVNNISYDKTRAATVKSGYLPDIDDVLKNKKGICFDYAALMVAMLRTQGIPSKLVVGYAGKQYHAWINVYTTESGWISKLIYFDGYKWKLADPTFAAGGAEDYTADASNYSVMFVY